MVKRLAFTGPYVLALQYGTRGNFPRCFARSLTRSYAVLVSQSCSNQAVNYEQGRETTQG